MLKVCDGEEQNRGYAAYLVRGAWITAGTALLILLLFLSLGLVRLSESGRHLLVVLVYSASIALPSMVLLTWVSHRYTERYPRLVILLQALLLMCAATFGCLFSSFLIQIVGIIPRGEYWHEFRSAFPFSIVITLMIGMSISFYETLRFKLQAAALELRTQQVEKERANKLLAEARLSSLESRIHPHFLFNTLNSVASLIPTDPQRAEDTVAKLASLLRFSLNANQSGLVPLGQELKIVRDYLDIEQTRFAARLRYQIAVPDSLEAVKVPPLALQTLVENSVKHVIAERPKGGEIRIGGSTEGGRILLEVTDDGPGFSLDTIPAGHGLANLISRLQLLFGDAGELQVTSRGESNTVRLSFPASTS